MAMSYPPSRQTAKVMMLPLNRRHARRNERYLLGLKRCSFSLSRSAFVHMYTYFFRATRPATISGICGCSSGSPPGIAYHRRPALLDSLEAILGRKLSLENVRRVLNLPASRACKVAAEQEAPASAPADTSCAPSSSASTRTSRRSKPAIPVFKPFFKSSRFPENRANLHQATAKTHSTPYLTSNAASRRYSATAASDAFLKVASASNGK